MTEKEKDNKAMDFLNKLREQAASTVKQPTQEDEDRKIKNTIRSWWKKETPGYHHFRYNDQGKPKTEIEFFAHHFAKAGVGMKDGWEFVKGTLQGYIDVESLEDGGEVWKEYEEEYNRTSFSQKFRDGFRKH